MCELAPSRNAPAVSCSRNTAQYSPQRGDLHLASPRNFTSKRDQFKPEQTNCLQSASLHRHEGGNMLRHFRIFALVISFIGMLSATATPGATATPFQFHTESLTKVTGNQHAGNDVFTTDAGKIECNEATQEGEISASTTVSITLTATYSGCTAFGFANTPIDTNGCHYTYTAITREGASFEGKKDISCPAGKSIEVTSFGCIVTIGSQNGLGKLTYTNVGTGTTREITIDSAFTEMKYEEHNKGIFPTCASNTVAKSNGTYAGAMLLTGEIPFIGTHRGVWVA